MAKKLDDSVFIARYLAVLNYMEEHKSATLEHTCHMLEVPTTSYYRGKELVEKSAFVTKAKELPQYTELTEPAFYLGNWFIPQVNYPITPKLRS